VRAHALERLLAARGRVHVVALEPEVDLQEAADDSVVVVDQDASGCPDASGSIGRAYRRISSAAARATRILAFQTRC
jgi:hypothetical protein